MLSGFTGTIEVVEIIAKEEEVEFAEAVEGVSQSYELRYEFAKFTVPDFMDWKKIERTSTMEELCSTENPRSLGLVPDSIKRKQKAATARPGTSADRRKERRRLHVQIPADVIE